MSINTGAYMAESVRGGFLSIDPGQTEGAKAIGMTHVQTMLYVIIPQALRVLLPQIGNNLIINIKEHLCDVYSFGFGELFSVHPWRRRPKLPLISLLPPSKWLLTLP